ncbi:hypothetical protein J6590_007386 [Homalodisca vitripennis]|nr:hypothetical protein J6590_007386 [Homalodisca vitripennis]
MRILRLELTGILISGIRTAGFQRPKGLSQNLKTLAILRVRWLGIRPQLSPISPARTQSAYRVVPLHTSLSAITCRLTTMSSGSDVIWGRRRVSGSPVRSSTLEQYNTSRSQIAYPTNRASKKSISENTRVPSLTNLDRPLLKLQLVGRSGRWILISYHKRPQSQRRTVNKAVHQFKEQVKVRGPVLHREGLQLIELLLICDRGLEVHMTKLKPHDCVNSQLVQL